MKTICFIFGTRPEAIKLAPVILNAQKRKDFKVQVCVTGQHREMLAPMLRLFSIEADLDLKLMQPDQSLGDFSGRTIMAVSNALDHLKPDCVIVQGDTTTVWAAAVSAFYKKIKVGHVEAGLRTNNKYQPFPEEINRRIVTQVADYHFAPTDWAKANLVSEGVDEKSIHVTGNTVVDALQYMIQKIERQPTSNVEETKTWYEQQIGSSRSVLITGHRRENFGEGFENICSAIRELASRYPGIHWIYPVHLNPNVQKHVHNILNGLPNVHLIKPQPYDAFVWLMQQSLFILSDSGGVQEEAPSLGKRAVIMRNTTERPEGVQAGVVKLAGSTREKIVDHCEELINNKSLQYAIDNPYGDGQASARILEILAQ
jgi:UDP-N-acetylglucosamine 2-epimerase (non-hydrolysing)